MMDAAWAAKLQAVFELSPTILTVTGLDDGRIVEVNDAFLLATGYSRDEVIGRSVPERRRAGGPPRGALDPQRRGALPGQARPRDRRHHQCRCRRHRRPLLHP